MSSNAGVTFENASDLELQKVMLELKSNLMDSWSVSLFIFISVIAIANSKKSSKYLVYGLLFISVLVLLLSIGSYSDDFYNTIPERSLSLRHKIDAVLYIAMTTLLVIVETSYVVYFVEFRK